MKELIEYPL